MKTLLFCTSLLENESLPKYAAWWKYYKSKFANCDFMILNDGPVDPQIFDKLKNLLKMAMLCKLFSHKGCLWISKVTQ